MSPKTLVVRTKLTPPRVHRRILHRERITRRLLEALDYRMTVVQAGAGYGKSTALAALAETNIPLVWYTLGPEDVDPLVLLSHLVTGFQQAFTGFGDSLQAALENWEMEHSHSTWAPMTDLLANQLTDCIHTPSLLVLDDAHRLNDAPDALQLVERLVSLAPADLHLIASTRYPFRLPGLVNLRVRDEVLQIEQSELAFTPAETATLFQAQYGFHLSEDELDELVANTEGWAIALQLYWQGLKSGALKLGNGQAASSVQSGDLFAYLAQEVLAKQSPDVQAFLLRTAILHDLTTRYCNEIRDEQDSASYLRYLTENSLFVIEIDDEHLRFHPLFRKFLLSRLSDEERNQANARAGECMLQAENYVDAVEYFNAAGQFNRAAGVLDDLGDVLIREGRLDALQKWIGALPPEILEQHPLLMARLGDVGRLRSRFNEAIGWYRQAEERSRVIGYTHGISMALRGQARVYLDTVNPTQAEKVLGQVLHLTDGQEDRESRARLLELMAENRLNLGKPDEAEQYQSQAQAIRDAGPSETELSVRVRLRTGRLAEARRILEQRMAVEQQSPIQQPRAHRETLLLLSLILVFQGEAEEAYRCAIAGVERGNQLHSPFITAVGYMRQGHARLVQGDEESFADACRLYEETIRLSESMAVPRLKVEALWGLCRARGFHRELAAAEQAAEMGVALAQAAGDAWIEGLICVSMSAGFCQDGRCEDGIRWLERAEAAFRGCSDTFGLAVASLWESLTRWAQHDEARLERALRDLLTAVRQNGYEFLFTRRTLLGPSDPRSLVPLLIYARDHAICVEEARSLLEQIGLETLEAHPGYTLRIQTLGAFRVWRGSCEISVGEWRREKARQLFQLLLINRRTPVDREQITETLWPGLDPDAAQRDFKVALSTLMRVLEPGRGKEEPSAYILRDGRLYGLRTNADLQLDAAGFEQYVDLGDRLISSQPEEALNAYREALRLYTGNFLQEYLFEDWLVEERERLLALYLRTGDRLARALAERCAWQEVIVVSQNLLSYDNCWEEAYRLLMLAYDQLGNRAQAMRVYRRCEQTLDAELGTQPSQPIRDLWEILRQKGTD